MTASPRPNLGGLFNGSAPPERSSSIADALGPRGVRLSAVADDTESERPAIGAPKRSSATDQRRIGPASPPTKTAPTAQDLHWPAPSWLDPIKAVEHYFAFLQTLLDANQRLALSMVTTVVSLPHRAKNWL